MLLAGRAQSRNARITKRKTAEEGRIGATTS